MAQIKGTNTSIEMMVRRYLFAQGFRFRKNDRRFPGKPDVVLPKYKAVIYVNGCFWHMHPGCKYSRIPKTNTGYWLPKLQKNAENDKLHEQQMKDMGWMAITLWECDLKRDFEGTMDHVIDQLKRDESTK